MANLGTFRKQQARRSAALRYGGTVLALLLVVFLSFSASAAGSPETSHKGETVEGGGGTDSQDKVLIKIHEKDSEAKTTFFNLATNEMLLKPSDGYVEMFRAETVLKALEVTYTQNEQRAVLTGQVSAFQPDLDLVADKLTAWLDTESYLAEGNVHLEQWNLDENDQRLDLKLSLDADRVDLDAKADAVHAEGDVYAEESDRRIWADSLDYDDQKQLMVLIGNVRVETESGSKLFGNRVVIDLATDEATVYGPVEAEFVIEEASEKETADTEPSPANRE